MEDNSLYIAGVKTGKEQGAGEGRVAAERAIILQLGQKKFGVPHESVLANINAITSEEKLIAIVDGIFEATSWQDLLKN